MDIQVTALTNAAIYLLPAGLPAAPLAAGGSGIAGLLGRAAEITIPNPKHKTIDYKGLGLAGALELWAGVDKLESTIKWSSFDAAVLSQIVNPFAVRAVQVMGSVEAYTSQGRSAEIPVIFLMSGMFKESGDTDIKQHEQVELTSKVAVYHAELYIAGVQIYLYDVFGNIYMVNGQDQLAQFRQNLGG